MKEWIIRNKTKYDEIHFSNMTGKLEGEIGTWYDPYNTELPLYWKNWEQEFDFCWHSYNPPPVAQMVNMTVDAAKSMVGAVGEMFLQ